MIMSAIKVTLDKTLVEDVKKVYNVNAVAVLKTVIEAQVNRLPEHYREEIKIEFKVE